MTLRKYHHAAEALLKIVRATTRNPINQRIRINLRRFVMQAHFMGLRPEDVLHADGHAAFETVARASMPTANFTLNAEWRMVENLARSMLPAFAPASWGE